MTPLHTLIALSFATLATACASPGAVTPAPSSTPPAAERAGQPGTSAPMAAMEPRMRAMHEMHQKMMNAKTPEERQALMADHMKAMQVGMGLMKDMSGMGGKAPMAGMGGMADAQGMPAEMAKRHQMMEQRMDMMQMMMEMMMDRMPPPPAAPK